MYIFTIYNPEKLKIYSIMMQVKFICQTLGLKVFAQNEQCIYLKNNLLRCSTQIVFILCLSTLI
jgi:hypothetical protein